MANARGLAIDKTHLSIDTAEERGFIHRDYIAHCLRWSHVVKWLQQRSHYKTARILDVGCGKEVPLAKMLYSSRLIPSRYAGIDVNKLTVPDTFHTGKFPIDLYSGDVCELTRDDLGFDPNTVVCFEVLEHIEPGHVLRVFEKVEELITDDGYFFISTPNYDDEVGAAGNHVNEMTAEVLGYLIEERGWIIERHYGTFASIKDYKDELSNQYGSTGNLIFNNLREYYDVNILSVIFAPLFPMRARNCLWQLKRPSIGTSYVRKFKYPVRVPWSSSEHWEKLLGR